MTPSVKTVLLLASTATQPAWAQITPIWQTSYQPTNFSLLHEAVTASDGATYVLSLLRVGNGPSDVDLGIARLNPDGTPGWETSFAGPNGQDVPAAIAMSWDQNSVLVLGRSSIPGFANSDYAVIKLDAQTGQEIWHTFVDGGDLGIDSPRDITATPDGGVAVTGGFDTATEQRDFGTAKLDASGQLLWSRLYSGQGPFLFENDDAIFVAVSQEGDIVVTGNAAAGSSTDIVTVKYDGTTGATIWEARYGSPSTEAVRGLKIASDGSVVILGQDPNGLDHQWVAAKYDGATGTELWHTLVDPGQDDSQRSIVVGSDGTVFATGATDPDGDDGNGNQDLIVIAYDSATGQPLWVTHFGDTGSFDGEAGNAIMLDSAGNPFVVGYTSSSSLVPTQFDTDALALSLDAQTGAVLDLSLISSPGINETASDVFRFLGVDSSGSFYATGTGDSQASLLTVRFDVGSPCPADINGDGVLDFFDVQAFLNASIDFNDDGTFDFFDVQSFLQTFSQGCP